MAKPYPEDITLIVPDNDLESRTIINLARELKFDKIRISGQTWGARLENEDPDAFKDLRREVWIIEIPGPEIEKELQLKGHIVQIIDHHSYRGLDRSKKLSSIEQFAKACHHQLTPEEQRVAINDRNYIWGLVSNGEPFDSVVSIRKKDLLCQGWAKEDFARAEEFYGSLSPELNLHERHKKNLFFCEIPFSRAGHFVDLFHLPDSAHYELLRAKESAYPRKNLLLLITEAGLVLQFSGTNRLKYRFLSHFYSFAHDYWHGGGGEYGFAGMIAHANVQKSALEEAVEHFLWMLED